MLVRENAQARQEGSQTVPERPPVGESQSNRISECAVGLVTGQAQNTEGRAGASRWDQSPARRMDALLAGGICCALDEQV